MSIVTLLLPTLLGGGLISAVVAFLRLKPDSVDAQFTNAKTSMDMMAVTNQQLQADRDQWRDRAITAEKRIDKLEAKVDSLERRGYQSDL